MNRHGRIVSIAMCGWLLNATPLVAQAVSGFPNPFGGRWMAELDTVEAEVLTEPISIFMADTMFFGEFVVRPAVQQLTERVAGDANCSWGQDDFSGRFYWDADREPILNFIEIFLGNPRGGDGCGFEMRMVARPDSTFVGWWCLGGWSDCRRQGAARLRRQR
jgi:hypothetical protein